MLENLKAKTLNGEEIQFSLSDIVNVEGQKADGIINITGIPCKISTIEENKKPNTIGDVVTFNPPEKERIFIFLKGKK